MSSIDSLLCAQCHQPIPRGAPFEQCPKCLLGFGSGSGTDLLVGAGLSGSGGSRSFGDYELVEEIARGGMGVVYRARQLNLGREVAVKMILGGELATAESVERFRNEAAAAARIDHPNIVSVYEIGEHEMQHFFSMRLVQGGGNIAAWAKKLAASPAQIAAMLAKVARAVAFAHERGVMHRDLKPSNILVDAKAEPQVTDFGLAKLVNEDSSLTLSAAMLGSPSYMAPEQADGRQRDVTTVTDVYGLGAVLYELLAGRPPFLGSSPLSTARRVIEDAPERLTNVPRDLETICLKCLEKDPTRRYRSAAALADDLERWLRHEPISARAPTAVERMGKWVRRKPIHAALAATVVIALAALVAGLMIHNRRITRAQTATEIANRELATHLRQVEWQQAEDSLTAGRTADAMAMFARFLRETPGDPIVTKRLTSLLELRAFALPTLPPFKHGAPVSLVRMDHSGQRLFTVADDGVLRSWNLTNGALEKEARLGLGHDYLWLLADGKRLVVTTKEGKVIVWNAERWELEHNLGEIPPLAAKLGLSEDGRFLSLITPQDEVQLWETTTGQLLSRTHLPGHELYPATDLGPAGETLIRGRLQGVWLWRPAANELLPLLGLNEGPVYAVCDWPRRRAFVTLEAKPTTNTRGIVSLNLDTGQELIRKSDAMPWHTMQVAADGKRLLVSRWGEGVNVLDADTLSEQYPTFAKAPIVAGVSPDRNFQVAFRSFHDGSGRLYDLSNGQPLMEPIQHEGPISSQELSPDGKMLVTASQDGTARLWDVRMRKVDATLVEAPDWIQKIALSPDGRRVAAAATYEFRVYDAGTGQTQSPSLRARDVIFDVTFSPDGRSLALASFDKSVRVLDSTTGKVVWVNEMHQQRAWQVVFSPDGRSVASASEDGTARVFDAASGRASFPPLQHEEAVTYVCFSPDNKMLATASVDASARLWDAATGQPIGPALRHRGTVWSVQFSPDGRRLLTSSLDRTAQVWDVRTGQPVGPPMRSDQGVIGAVFSSDGQRVLIRTLNSARIFDAHTSEPLTPPMRHADQVKVALFSPDGRWVATGSDDGVARIWDAASGFPVTEPLVHRSAVTSLAWLPDSRSMLTASKDHDIRLWKLPEIDSASSWLPDLAEALAGKRDDGKGGHISASTEPLNALRENAEKGGNTPEARWLRGLLIERLQKATP